MRRGPNRIHGYSEGEDSQHEGSPFLAQKDAAYSLLLVNDDPIPFPPRSMHVLRYMLLHMYWRVNARREKAGVRWWGNGQSDFMDRWCGDGVALPCGLGCWFYLVDVSLNSMW